MMVLFNSGGCSATNNSSSCWLGLSVNESLLELLAVEVAVLAFPPVLSVIPPPPPPPPDLDKELFGSGDLARIEGPSWIEGRPWKEKYLITLS